MVQVAVFVVAPPSSLVAAMVRVLKTPRNVVLEPLVTLGTDAIPMRVGTETT